MTKSRGVILLNMGGPNSLKAVRPFLYNLFSDREIIPLGPPFLQKFIAWMIARKRAPISRETYRKIGGASPLEKITRAQAKALEETLCQEGEDWHVSIAMRYWPPYADEALDEMLADRVEEITAVSLYPHYTKATTGSSLNHLQTAMKRRGIKIPLRTVESWPEEPDYIYTLAAGIKKTLIEMQEKTSEEIAVVYSAHSLPVSFIEEGDPYVDHLKQTIAAVEKQTGVTGTLCFQSRSGPVEWLAPSTPDTVTRLASEGCKAMIMVPISFVSDHVETLYEIDMLYRNQAEELGVIFASTPSLNTDPRFINALASLVKNPRL